MHVHKWNQNPPTKGRSWCIRCKDVYRGRGRPAQTASFDLDALVDVASEMSGVVREDDTFDGNTDETASEKRFENEQVTPVTASPPPTPRWAKWAAPKLTKIGLMLATHAGSMLKPPRKAKTPEQIAVDEFNEAFSEQLPIWFPNMELSPLKKMLMAGGAVISSMYIGAEKIESTEHTANVQVADSDTKPEAKQPTKVIPITRSLKLPDSLFKTSF